MFRCAVPIIHCLVASGDDLIRIGSLVSVLSTYPENKTLGDKSGDLQYGL